MELLGEILHFSKSGRLIIKVDKNNTNHRPGSQVYTEGERKIGKIAELIGPVGSPYASILPYIQSRSKMSGSKVFTTAFLKNPRTSRSRKSIRRNKK